MKYDPSYLSRCYLHPPPGGILHTTRRGSESILFVSPYPIHRITGIGRFVLDLTKKLLERGVGTTILSPRGGPRESQGGDFEIPLRAVCFANLELALKTARRMLAARQAFQVVHAQQAHLQSLAACLIARILG